MFQISVGERQPLGAKERKLRRYFTDRRPVQGELVRRFLADNFAWNEGMRDLCAVRLGLGRLPPTCC